MFAGLNKVSTEIQGLSSPDCKFQRSLCSRRLEVVGARKSGAQKGDTLPRTRRLLSCAHYFQATQANFKYVQGRCELCAFAG